MPWGKDVWVTGYPDLMRLRDTDGDGRADVTETVFRGFGVHAAFDGHDLHGLTIGPEGKIYFSCSDNGFNVTNREGACCRIRIPGRAPNGSGRIEPRGVCQWTAQSQEVAFDEYGNPFAVDNDGDLRDERERFVFIAEGVIQGGGSTGSFTTRVGRPSSGQPDYNPWWMSGCGFPIARTTGPHHASDHQLLGRSRQFQIQPGHGAERPLPRAFFHPVSCPESDGLSGASPGAGFEMVGEHTVLSGMMASAVNFSPDGALAVGDWDGMGAEWDGRDLVAG